MSTFTLLPSPVWPLPICLDSWTWHSRFLRSIALYSIGLCFYHQSHPQLGVIFALAPYLHSFWSNFSTDLQYQVGHLATWGVHLSESCLFAFSYCSWGSQGKNTEVVCQSLLQWTTFCQTSAPWPIRLGWPHTAWLSFTELDKAVVHVIRLANFLSALWCPLSGPTVFLGFLLPWMWGMSSRPLLLSHSTAASPLSCFVSQGQLLLLTSKKEPGWEHLISLASLWALSSSSFQETVSISLCPVLPPFLAKIFPL